MTERFGDYELIQQIATGGMAEIYLARLIAMEGFTRPVVVKRMLPQLAVRQDFVQMFLDEARLAANLQHQNIVQVFNLGEVSGAYFMAMELVDGPHLGALFAHSLRQRKPLPIELCAYIVGRGADGLHYAHDRADPMTGMALQIVHRDISPQNILVSRQGDVKVTDFGVARSESQQTKTRTGIIKGKVAYMSPEQCLGEQVDRRTDVFALGIVLYELLTRRRLFRDKSDLLIMQRITSEDVAPASTLNPGVDAELDEIAKKALARDRDKRYSTAAELSEALDGWLATRAAGDSRAKLQKWITTEAAELAPGLVEQAAKGGSSPSKEAWSKAPSAVSTLPGQAADAADGHGSDEATSATPSLSSRETQIRMGSNRATALDSQDSQDSQDSINGGAGLERTRRAMLVDQAQNAIADDDAPDDADPDQTADSAPAVRAVLRQGATMELRPPPATPKKPPMAAIAGGAAAALLLLVVALFALRGGDEPKVPGPSGSNGSVAPTPAPPVDPPSVVVAPVVAPVVAGGGRLIIETEPSGVRVYVDDDALKAVPDGSPFIVDRPPGTVRIEARFDGQPPVSKLVELQAGDELKVRLLAKVPLIVRSNPKKAIVKLDAQVRGETPLEGVFLDPEVPVRLRIVGPQGYADHDETITPRAGTPIVVDRELRQERKESVKSTPSPAQPAVSSSDSGMLSLRCEPWANAKLGESRLGVSPFIERKVRAGTQRLTLTNPDVGISESIMITIPKDKTLFLDISLEKSGSGYKVVKKKEVVRD